MSHANTRSSESQPDLSMSKSWLVFLHKHELINQHKYFFDKGGRPTSALLDVHNYTFFIIQNHEATMSSQTKKLDVVFLATINPQTTKILTRSDQNKKCTIHRKSLQESRRVCCRLMMTSPTIGQSQNFHPQNRIFSHHLKQGHDTNMSHCL